MAHESNFTIPGFQTAYQGRKELLPPSQTNVNTAQPRGTNSGTNEEGTQWPTSSLPVPQELTNNFQKRDLGTQSEMSCNCVQVLSAWQEYTRQTYLQKDLDIDPRFNMNS